MPKLDLMFAHDMAHTDSTEMVKTAEVHGFRNAWVWDSTDVYDDYFVLSGIYAVNTSRIRIGPGVTNPRTRHPRVTANAMLTIHEISRGRAILGIGSGDHAVKTLGWRRATLSEMKEAVQIWREKFRQKGADIPIYAAIGGPMMDTFAFQYADGIIGGGGNTPESLRRAYQRIAARLKEAGRDIKKVPWLSMGMGCAISYDRREALDDARGPLARMLKGMIIDRPGTFPPALEHLRADAERVAKAYDYMKHMKSHVPHAELVTDALVEGLSVAGTPDEVLPKLKALWEEGKRLEAEEGADICFSVGPPGKGKKRSFDLFVQEILPHLN
ncbi:MAG: LLM class flavin-dependent oxidoreductase [Chloroflexi bacterium]|nr:LLM class flavin-dependent oxidoreductase [Chloroflexota bacterium]